MRAGFAQTGTFVVLARSAIDRFRTHPRQDLNLWDDTFVASCKEIFIASLNFIDSPRIVLGIIFDKH